METPIRPVRPPAITPSSRFFNLPDADILCDDSSPSSRSAIVVLPHLHWAAAPEGVVLSADRLSLVRGSGAGFRTTLCDRWFSQGITTIELHCEKLGASAVLGVVDHNYCRAQPRWWEADLTQSRHAIAVHLGSGQTFCKGKRNALRALPRPRSRPRSSAIVPAGAVIRLELDQQRRELTVQLREEEAAQDDDVTTAVTLEGLPYEVTVGLSLGEGEHRVRILRSDDRPADSPPLRQQNHRDLWDPHNVVSPLRSPASQRTSTQDSLLDVENAIQDAIVFEAGRLGDGAGA